VKQQMKRDEAIRILTANWEQIRVMGVSSMSIFGSVARDEASPQSDVDVLIELDRPIGFFELFDIQDRLEELLGCKVDIGTARSLKPRLRERVLREAVRVA
jgi:hypothetical protein